MYIENDSFEVESDSFEVENNPGRRAWTFSFFFCTFQRAIS